MDDRIRALHDTLLKQFHGEIRDESGQAGRKLFEAAGLVEHQHRGLLREAEKLGLIERQIHDRRTILIRKARTGFERVEPRDLIPPSPAWIAMDHLERSWEALQLQDRRVMDGDDSSIIHDFAFYLLACRWLILAVRLTRQSVEGAPEALGRGIRQIEKRVLARNMRNVLEHFDAYERGKGHRGSSTFPYISDDYVTGEDFACVSINEEEICLPEATDLARKVYERTRVFLNRVLQDERNVYENE